MSAIRRYFPEWAHRPVQSGVAREAERNSYLAGGYAEEFGYWTSPGCPPALPALKENPERDGLWRTQIGALHPGYPERPAPLDWADADEHVAMIPTRARAGLHGAVEHAAVEFRTILISRNTGRSRGDRPTGSRLLAMMRAIGIRRRESER